MQLAALFRRQKVCCAATRLRCAAGRHQHARNGLRLARHADAIQKLVDGNPGGIQTCGGRINRAKPVARQKNIGLGAVICCDTAHLQLVGKVDGSSNLVLDFSQVVVLRTLQNLKRDLLQRSLATAQLGSPVSQTRTLGIAVEQNAVDEGDFAFVTHAGKQLVGFQRAGKSVKNARHTRPTGLACPVSHATGVSGTTVKGQVNLLDGLLRAERRLLCLGCGIAPQTQNHCTGQCNGVSRKKRRAGFDGFMNHLKVLSWCRLLEGSGWRRAMRTVGLDSGMCGLQIDWQNWCTKSNRMKQTRRCIFYMDRDF